MIANTDGYADLRRWHLDNNAAPGHREVYGIILDLSGGYQGRTIRADLIRLHTIRNSGQIKSALRYLEKRKLIKYDREADSVTLLE